MAGQQKATPPTDRALCPIHGIIQARGMVNHARDAVQWTCLACRKEYSVASREGYQLGFSYTIPKCHEKHPTKGRCLRPTGHGGEVHQSKKGVWPVEH